MSLKLLSEALDSNLSCTHKMVLICLSNYANEEGFCSVKKETIFTQCGMSRKTLDRAIDYLVQNGIIKVVKQWGDKLKNRALLYQIFVQKIINSFKKETKKLSTDGGQNDAHEGVYGGQNDAHKPLDGGQNDAHKIEHSILDNNINYIYNKNKREIVKRDEKIKNLSSDDVHEVFCFWKSELNHTRAVLDAKRKKLIEKALSTHDVQFLKEAIIGNKLSTYHQGENDRKLIYSSIELILRDVSKTEYFQEIFENKSKEIAKKQKREAELFKPAESVTVSTDEWKNLMMKQYSEQFKKIEHHSKRQIST